MVDPPLRAKHRERMSAIETLIHELQGQPEAVARKALDYLRGLPEWQNSDGVKTRPAAGCFDSYWREFYGAFEGEPWEEPPELPAERRESW